MLRLTKLKTYRINIYSYVEKHSDIVDLSLSILSGFQKHPEKGEIPVE